MHLSDLRRTASVWQTWGQKNPLYAILSSDKKWEVDEFFATGQQEVDAFIAHCGEIGLTLPTGTALDFGCGVGRLSRALARHFQKVIGIDIAASMIEQARQYNPGESFQFLVNTAPNLQILPDASVDFVFSRIVLQHIPPPVVKEYLTEFYRVLRPGGIMAIHIPSTPENFAPGFKARLRNIIGRKAYNRLAWAVSHRTLAAIDMHYIPEPEVISHLRGVGAKIIAVEKILPNPIREHRQYIAAKP